MTLSPSWLSAFGEEQMNQSDDHPCDSHYESYTSEGQEYSGERCTVLSEAALVEAVLDACYGVVSKVSALYTYFPDSVQLSMVVVEYEGCDETGTG